MEDQRSDSWKSVVSRKKDIVGHWVAGPFINLCATKTLTLYISIANSHIEMEKKENDFVF